MLVLPLERDSSVFSFPSSLYISIFFVCLATGAPTPSLPRAGGLRANTSLPMVLSCSGHALITHRTCTAQVSRRRNFTFTCYVPAQTVLPCGLRGKTTLAKNPVLHGQDIPPLSVALPPQLLVFGQSYIHSHFSFSPGAGPASPSGAPSMARRRGSAHSFPLGAAPLSSTLAKGAYRA